MSGSPPELAAELGRFPDVLRALIEAELAAGNAIVEVASGFPAPPAGASVKLARRVSSRPRASGGGVQFFERTMPSYSGEFTDERRFFFVLEPPVPPPPEPDMDALRAAAQPRGQPLAPAHIDLAGSAPVGRREPADSAPAPRPAHVPTGPASSAPQGAGRVPPTSTVVEAFRASMAIDYEKWHDGIGYDVALIASATPEERAGIEALLLQRDVDDWRDVEALAALATPRALAALRAALLRGKSDVKLAVLRHAPQLADDTERTKLLVAALRNARFYEGLTQALDQVEAFHPPEVVTALVDGVRSREGEVAVHFAAMLMYLHGQASSPFDWDQRPFFLRFHTEDGVAREAAYRELCAKIGITP